MHNTGRYHSHKRPAVHSLGYIFYPADHHLVNFRFLLSGPCLKSIEILSGCQSGPEGSLSKRKRDISHSVSSWRAGTIRRERRASARTCLI